MAGRRGFALLFVCALLGNTFAVPVQKRALENGGEVNSNGNKQLPSSNDETSRAKTPSPFDDEDDDDDDLGFTDSPPSSGGSNVFSLLKLAGALFPGSSGVTVKILTNLIRRYLRNNQITPKIEPNHRVIRSARVEDNKIDVDYPDFKPPAPPKVQVKVVELPESQNHDIKPMNPTKSEKQEIDEENSELSDSESNSEEQNGAAEEDNRENGDNGSDENNDSDYDDEPPGGGDGQGGGILGILAGLSGGEEGSDLGTLLATVGGIVANLSGDGIDLNALIASGLGLFVGLLSEGNENPGSVIASYLLTSLDTITGGGSKNNGAFFGSFLSKLIKGISAAEDEDDSSEENGGNGGMKDSAGFVLSFIMGLLGDMSKGSSSGSAKAWDRLIEATR